jgi:hypothetical protein
LFFYVRGSGARVGGPRNVISIPVSTCICTPPTIFTDGIQPRAISNIVHDVKGVCCVFRRTLVPSFFHSLFRPTHISRHSSRLICSHSLMSQVPGHLHLRGQIGKPQPECTSYQRGRFHGGTQTGLLLLYMDLGTLSESDAVPDERHPPRRGSVPIS